MILLIDSQSVQQARLINTVVDRSYYLIPIPGSPDAIVVLRNGLSLSYLDSKAVDCTIGWDTAQAGFVQSDQEIGTVRTKVTVFGVADTATRTLTEQLRVSRSA